MPAPYFVLVVGKRGAKKPHSSYEIASGEAKRLHDVYEGRATVIILETAHSLDQTNFTPKPEPEIPAPMTPGKRKKDAAKARLIDDFAMASRGEEPPTRGPVIKVKKRKTLEV